MSKFIITAKEERFSAFRGEKMPEPKRALYYDPSIGRHRIFRMSLDVKPKKMRLLTFENEINAKKICDNINQKFNDNFEVEALFPDTKSEESKYHFAREIMFTLRSCNAITEAVYLHWIDKLNKDEEALSSKLTVGVSVCKTCGHSYDDDVYCKDCSEKQTN